MEGTSTEGGWQGSTCPLVQSDFRTLLQHLDLREAQFCLWFE